MNEDFKKIKDITDKIGGWTTDRECKFLYDTARKCVGRGVIVELGSWKGKSTIWLSKGSHDGQRIKIYAIDPHTGAEEQRETFAQKKASVWTYDEFMGNIRDAQVQDLVIPIVKTSEEAAFIWKDPIEFLWIDAAHDYANVKKDFEKWFPHLIEGGIIAFHDTMGWPGPKRVVVDNLYRSTHFKDVGFIDSITFATKVSKNSLQDRIKNYFTLFIQDTYGALRFSFVVIKRGGIRELFNAPKRLLYKKNKMRNQKSNL